MRPIQDSTPAAGSDIHLLATAHRPPTTEPSRGESSSSGTWTATSGELGFLSDADKVDERSQFVQEYNRLAKRVGLLPSSWSQLRGD